LFMSKSAVLSCSRDGISSGWDKVRVSVPLTDVSPPALFSLLELLQELIRSIPIIRAIVTVLFICILFAFLIVIRQLADSCGFGCCLTLIFHIRYTFYAFLND